MPRTDATARATRPAAGHAALWLTLIVLLVLTAACRFVPGTGGAGAGGVSGADGAIRVDVLPAPDGAAGTSPAPGTGPGTGPAPLEGSAGVQANPEASTGASFGANPEARPAAPSSGGGVPGDTAATGTTGLGNAATPSRQTTPAQPAPTAPAPTAPDLTAPDPTSPAPVAPFFAAEQAACLARGGVYQRVGPSDIRACVTATRDGGRSCSSGADCDGACLARSGTCAPVTPLYGCHEIVQNNGLRTTQCLQ